MHWKSQSSEIVLSFIDKSAATIKVDQQADYTSFELKQLTNAADAELILWGPYPTIIGDTIGEVVGVVRNKEFRHWHTGIEYKNTGRLSFC
jgi:hypothetical protein